MRVPPSPGGLADDETGADRGGAILHREQAVGARGRSSVGKPAPVVEGSTTWSFSHCRVPKLDLHERGVGVAQRVG